MGGRKPACDSAVTRVTGTERRKVRSKAMETRYKMDAENLKRLEAKCLFDFRSGGN
jgi:hypothetical protein